MRPLAERVVLKLRDAAVAVGLLDQLPGVVLFIQRLIVQRIASDDQPIGVVVLGDIVFRSR